MSALTEHHQDAPAAQEREEQAGAQCDYCGRDFVAYRASQRFCTEEHRRAFETIVGKVSAVVRAGIRTGVREMLAAHRSPHGDGGSRPQ